MTENAEPIQSGKPFTKGVSGNPAGKPKGARHRTTLAIEALLDGEAEALTRTAIEAAKAGDMTALRLCMDRIAPPPKGRRVWLDLPQVETAADVTKAISAALSAVADGSITIDEGAQIAGLVEIQRRAIETQELEQRLSALERAKENKR